MMLKPTQSTESGGSLSERVYQSLLQAILELKLQPGDRIDKKVLASELGVSLFPVSEAITQLSAEGIVDVYPQAGTYVTPFLMAEILEGAFLREALEVAAVERVAEVVKDNQIAALRRNFRIQEVMVADGDSEGFFLADKEMHEILLRATGLPKLLSLTETLWLQAERARRLIVETPGRAKMGLEEHRAIVEAIAARDPEGARLGMKRHLARVANDLRELENTYPKFFAPAKADIRRKV